MVWEVLEVLLVGMLVVGLTAGLNTVLVPLYVSNRHLLLLYSLEGADGEHHDGGTGRCPAAAWPPP